METDDNALALAAGEGDRAAFAALIDRHYDRIFRFAWRLTGAADQAEDLAQDVSILLARRIRQFRGDAKFTTWLYQVTLNAARDAGRRNATRCKAMDRYAEDLDRSMAEDRDRATSAEWLQTALATLRDDWRETAALVVGEGLTQAEAGEALGISEGTVAWRMTEVKKALTAFAEAEAKI
jgi:RNA polymerase sigma-70 factor (ECF subfamily)